jgi:hypothetical protein
VSDHQVPLCLLIKRNIIERKNIKMNKEIIIAFPMIMMIFLGIAIGMYISSQIMGSIESNIRQKKLMKNVEEYEKKKIK